MKTHTDFMIGDKWVCTKCGACCKMVTELLPHFDSGNGVCIHLKDNLCSIYEKRPKICHVNNFGGTELEKALACAWVHNKVESKNAISL